MKGAATDPCAASAHAVCATLPHMGVIADVVHLIEAAGAPELARHCYCEP